MAEDKKKDEDKDKKKDKGTGQDPQAASGEPPLDSKDG